MVKGAPKGVQVSPKRVKRAQNDAPRFPRGAKWSQKGYKRDTKRVPKEIPNVVQKRTTIFS